MSKEAEKEALLKSEKHLQKIGELVVKENFENRRILDLMFHKLHELVESNPEKYTHIHCLGGPSEVDGVMVNHCSAQFFFLMLENIKRGNVDISKLEKCAG